MLPVGKPTAQLQINALDVIKKKLVMFYVPCSHMCLPSSTS